jgi:dienelactone hydrolase
MGARRWFSLGAVGFLCLIVNVQAASALEPDSGYRLFKPKGAGRHPAVVFVPGCSGFAPEFSPHHYERAAQRLSEAGYVVVFADYLRRRGVETCGSVSHSEAGGDAVAAAAWLKAQPYVDGTRIAALGWSYGGGAVLAALADHAADQLPFSRAIVYYPDCRSVRPWTTGTPLLVLLAGEDSVAPGAWCQTVLTSGDIAGTSKVVVYPGAQHAFDAAELPPKLRIGFGTIGHQPEAAAAAWRQVLEFLRAGRSARSGKRSH